MSASWRDSFWGRHALLYHLYLVVLKDNYYRAIRAPRLVRVHLRLALRWVRWWLTGRHALVPRVVNQKKIIGEIVRRISDQAAFLSARDRDNRTLLTGMVVALTSGHSVFLTGWQRYKYAAQRRSYAKDVPMKIIGRPSVLKYRDTKIGLTEFSQDYTPRREALAARGRRKYQ